MRIHEPWDDGATRKRHPVASRLTRSDDSSILHSQEAIANRRTGYRADPVGFVNRHEENA